MAKDDKITLDAEVTEALPDAMFRVRLQNDKEILAYVSGKMRKFFIRILPGDKVTIELSPYGTHCVPFLRKRNYESPQQH